MSVQEVQGSEGGIGGHHTVQHQVDVSKNPLKGMVQEAKNSRESRRAARQAARQADAGKTSEQTNNAPPIDIASLNLGTDTIGQNPSQNFDSGALSSDTIHDSAAHQSSVNHDDMSFKSDEIPHSNSEMNQSSQLLQPQNSPEKQNLQSLQAELSKSPLLSPQEKQAEALMQMTSSGGVVSPTAQALKEAMGTEQNLLTTSHNESEVKNSAKARLANISQKLKAIIGKKQEQREEIVKILTVKAPEKKELAYHLIDPKYFADCKELQKRQYEALRMLIDMAQAEIYEKSPASDIARKIGLVFAHDTQEEEPWTHRQGHQGQEQEDDNQENEEEETEEDSFVYFTRQAMNLLVKANARKNARPHNDVGDAMRVEMMRPKGRILPSQGISL